MENENNIITKIDNEAMTINFEKIVPNEDDEGNSLVPNENKQHILKVGFSNVPTQIGVTTLSSAHHYYTEEPVKDVKNASEDNVVQYKISTTVNSMGMSVNYEKHVPHEVNSYTQSEDNENISQVSDESKPHILKISFGNVPLNVGVTLLKDVYKFFTDSELSVNSEVIMGGEINTQNNANNDIVES